MNCNLVASRLLIPVLCLLCVLSSNSVADEVADGATQSRKILILHSYHEGLAWTDGEEQGIRDTIGIRTDIEISTEYLDSKRIPLEDIAETFADFLARKYATTSFDAIIVSDNNALTFLSRYHKTLFPGVPVVFCGINNFKPEMLREFGDLVTGVVQTLEPAGTLNLIQKLQPGLQNLAVVSGTTPTARTIRDAVAEALAEREESFQIVWLDGLDTNTLQKRLAELSRDDAVLLCNFNRDANGVYYSHEASARMISEASNAPVYAMEDLYVGTGVTGGHVVSAKDQGSIAAGLCLEIFATGKIPDVEMTCPNMIMVDYHAMTRFGLERSLLPPSATIVNQPMSFYARHKRLIWNAAIVFDLLLLALVTVIILLARAREAAKQLRNSEENLHTTLNSIGDAVIATDAKGCIVRMNPVAAQLTGWESADARGNELTKVFQIVNTRTNEPVANPVSRVLESGQIVGLANHTTLVARDGAEYQIADSAAPIRDSNGVITGVVLVFRDVTAEYRTREKVRANEAKFRGLVESSSDWIWETDADGNYTYASPQIEEILGYKPEEVIGKTPFDMMSAEEALRIAEIFNKSAEKGESISALQNICKHKDGRQVVLETSGIPVVDEAGKVIGYRGVDRDITDRKQAEDALRESERKLREAQQMALLGNWYWDIKTGDVDWSEEVYQIFHLDREEFEPQIESIMALSPWPEDNQRNQELIQKARENREPGSFEQRFLRPDGSTGYYFSTFQGIYDDAGELTAIKGTVQDVTERKQAEEALRESEANLQSIFRVAPVGIGLVSNRIVRRVNERLCEMTGYSREELDGQNARMLYPTDEDFDYVGREKYRQIAERGTGTVETRWRRKDGVIIDILLSSTPLDPDDLEIGVMFTALDITDRKRAEEALERRLVALTQPLEDAADIGFEDLFNLDEIQRLQDEFASATGVASIITNTDGTPITEPSNFCRLCIDIIRKTEKGCANCFKSDATLGRFNPQGPTVETCLSGGLWDAGAAISVGGKHIANWLIGQVRDEAQTEEKMRAYAREIGADEDAAVEAFREVPAMSREQFERVAQALFTLAKQLSDSAFQNVQQARFITEHKRTEEALRASERNYREIFNASNDAIVVHDMATGAIVDVNRTMCEMFEYSHEEALRLRVQDISQGEPPYSQAEAAHWIQRACEEGSQTFEWLCRKREGELFWAEISLSRVTIGGKDRVIAVDRDITERKQAEEALRASEKRLVTAQHIARMGDFTWNVDTGEATWSDALYDLLKYDKSDKIDYAKVNAEIHHPEDLHRVTKWLNDCIASDADVLTPNEYRLIRKDGEVIFVRVEGIIQRTAGASPKVFATVLDITERKRAEEALRESEEQYRYLFETMTQGVVYQDAEGRVISANPAAERILGLSLDQMQGRTSCDPHWRAIHEDGSEFPGQTHPAMVALQTGREVRDVIMGIYHPIRDDHVWTRVSAAPQFKPGEDKPYRVYATIEDITERKRAGDELASTTSFLNAVVDMSPFAMWISDPEGTIIRTNQSLREILNLTDEQIIGKYNVLADANLETQGFMPAVKDVFRKHKLARFSLPWQAVKSGDVGFAEARDLHLDVSFFPILNSDGELVHVVCQWVDITERTRAEEALLSEKLLSEDYINSLPGLFYVFDEERFVRWNNAWEKITGYSDEELSVMYGPDFFDGEDKKLIEERMQKVFREGTAEAEAELVTKDGRRIPYYVTGLRREFDGKPHLVGLGLDITDRKRAEEERRELEAQLRQSQKLEAVGQLAGGVAHDFNNILTAILGNIELSMDEVRDKMGVDHNVVQSMEQIEKSARRASALTRQLLTFSRRDVVQPQNLNLNQILADLDKMLQRLITENITLETVVGQNLKSVRADAGQIEQVIVNLVVNAVHAMPDGGRLTLETQNVTLDEDYTDNHAEARSGPHVMLAISDTGHGMGVETIERIFEPFFTTKPVDQGAGLGLSTVHGIVKQSGGHIMVYSEPGRGTTFKVYLPTVDGVPADQVPTTPGAAALQGNETILLCEDDAPVRELIARSLKISGYKVITASGGKEGILAAEGHDGKIDLLITDVIMPDMNGRALSEHLRASRPEMPTLYISGYTSNVIAHHGVLDEGVEFLEKPFTRQSLLAKIRAVLNKAHTDV